MNSFSAERKQKINPPFTKYSSANCPSNVSLPLNMHTHTYIGLTVITMWTWVRWQPTSEVTVWPDAFPYASQQNHSLETGPHPSVSHWIQMKEMSLYDVPVAVILSGTSQYSNIRLMASFFFKLTPDGQNHSGFYWGKRWWGGKCIRWTISKSFAPCSREITTPAPHHLILTGRMLFLTHYQQCYSHSTEDNKMLICWFVNTRFKDSPSRMFTLFNKLLPFIHSLQQRVKSCKPKWTANYKFKKLVPYVDWRSTDICANFKVTYTKTRPDIKNLTQSI